MENIKKDDYRWSPLFGYLQFEKISQEGRYIFRSTEDNKPHHFESDGTFYHRTGKENRIYHLNEIDEYYSNNR